ncbi:hypothetical protein HDU98_011913, partial [Podochytrium sp. JEL0797]
VSEIATEVVVPVERGISAITTEGAVAELTPVGAGAPVLVSENVMEESVEPDREGVVFTLTRGVAEGESVAVGVKESICVGDVSDSQPAAGIELNVVIVEDLSVSKTRNVANETVNQIIADAEVQESVVIEVVGTAVSAVVSVEQVGAVATDQVVESMPQTLMEESVAPELDAVVSVEASAFVESKGIEIVIQDAVGQSQVREIVVVDTTGTVVAGQGSAEQVTEGFESKKVFEVASDIVVEEVAVRGLATDAPVKNVIHETKDVAIEATNQDITVASIASVEAVGSEPSKEIDASDASATSTSVSTTTTVTHTKEIALDSTTIASKEKNSAAGCSCHIILIVLAVLVAVLAVAVILFMPEMLLLVAGGTCSCSNVIVWSNATLSTPDAHRGTHVLDLIHNEFPQANVSIVVSAEGLETAAQRIEEGAHTVVVCLDSVECVNAFMYEEESTAAEEFRIRVQKIGSEGTVLAVTNLNAFDDAMFFTTFRDAACDVKPVEEEKESFVVVDEEVVVVEA